jgi:hypothetical protein
MERWSARLTLSCILVLGCSYGWVHLRHIATTPTTEQAANPGPTYTEAEEATKMVTVTGPMADFLQRQKSSDIVTIEPTSRRSTTVDHVGNSPVGTSDAFLHKTFPVANVVDVPFEIPPHAANPQLRGTYHSFVTDTHDVGSPADVEFLLLNEKQYFDFLSGRPGEAVFSAADAPDQEVNTSMSPTFGKPAKYYLIFRNNSRPGGKKVVQADFRVDF